MFCFLTLTQSKCCFPTRFEVDVEQVFKLKSLHTIGDFCFLKLTKSKCCFPTRFEVDVEQVTKLNHTCLHQTGHNNAFAYKRARWSSGQLIVNKARWDTFHNSTFTCPLKAYKLYMTWRIDKVPLLTLSTRVDLGQWDLEY